MIKVGIIGYGKMGRIREKALSNSGQAKVIQVFDPNAADTELPVVESADDILQNPKIDAVFICTPNCFNKPLTMQALESGKHVFCEKPPAFTARQVEEIREVEKASGKVLMYGFNHRHHNSIKHMKSLIDSAEYGNVLWMRGRYGKSMDQSFYDDWRSKKELAGGGILMDQGIHMVDLFLYFGGEFNAVHAVVSNLYWKLDVEDNVFATFYNTKSGIVASLHSTMTQWRHLFSLEIFLEKGYLVLNGLRTSSGTYGDEILTIAKNRTSAPMATWKDEEHINYNTDVSWIAEIQEFIGAIEENREVRVGSSDDALRLMRMIDRVYDNKRMWI